ncbi:MAG: helix-turn-helix domain-containing protein [Sphingobacteriales bacterium]
MFNRFEGVENLSTRFTLTNRQNGNLAFKLFSFEDNSHFDHVQRNNFYSLIWVKEGEGTLKADFSDYSYKENTLFAFAPYQPFMFAGNPSIRGVAIQFHSDFYCIHRNPTETSCDTVIFNNIYEPPFISLDTEEQETFNLTLNLLNREIKNEAESKDELLVYYLKILLVNAVRIKNKTQTNAGPVSKKSSVLLQNLKKEIESNFKEKHSPGDYAALLNISSNALAKITKNYFNKTLSDLIAERIIIEAKRELYFTDKTVKEIAYYLGYQDEYYFSRFFKLNAEVSPQLYRERVGFNRAPASDFN